MAPRKEISVEIRNLVIQHRKDNKSYGEISKILNLSRATVQTIVKNFQNNGSTENMPRSGRPCILSRRDISLVLKEVDQNSKVTAPKLAEYVADSLDKCVHPRTIQRYLNNNGFHSRTPRKNPLISEKNRKLRMEFARAYKAKGMDFWQKVLFTDESKFNIFGSDGRAKVWRKKNTALSPKNLVLTVKHGGGNVMVWGAVAASGVGRIEFIEGNMDRYKYKTILEQNLKQSVDRLELGAGWILQQDNDPKHTAHIVKYWLLYHAPRQLNTPPQSPDLNIIEHVWEILERKIRKNQISSAATLKERIISAWNSITAAELTNLVASMPRRLQAVIDANGGPTKY